MKVLLVLKVDDDTHLSAAQKVIRALQEQDDCHVQKGWVAIDSDASQILTVLGEPNG